MSENSVAASEDGKSIGAKLKDAADRHIGLVVVSIFVAGVGFGAAPIPFINSAHESTVRSKDERIERLDTQLGSVTRTINEDRTIEFAVDELIVTSDEAQDLPTSLEYIEDDDFYVPRLGAGELVEWSFDKTTEGGLFELQGQSSDELPLTQEMLDLPVNLWSGPQSFELAAQREDPPLITFPFVALERISEATLSEFLVKIAGNEDVRGFVEEDPLGAMFQLNVVLLASTYTTYLSPVLSDVQRSREAVYAEVTLVFHDVLVDGILADSFYVKRELIFLQAGDDIIFITTNLPSSDRRPVGSSAVTALLSGIRVVE